ncbi:MAG: hypothetical protein JKY93_02615 [Gammaproteobacteria bacterium]|nr:hypothetical protein [Gammaproteobacteria bacterium]
MDHAHILQEHGFNDPDAIKDTALAYVYEINGVMFDDDSPFDLSNSTISDNVDDSSIPIRCMLYLKENQNIDDACRYLMDKWYHYLYQSDAMFESIQKRVFAVGVEIDILTISKTTACSIEFRIADMPSIFISKPSMPGKFDAVYCEVDIRDGYHAIAHDSDPYTAVTISKQGTSLFTAYVGDHNESIPLIEKNLEKYLAQILKDEV